MRDIEDIKNNNRFTIKQLGVDGGSGLILLPINLNPKRKLANVVFSWGMGWDHVSVSYNDRCLTWEEMCIVKDIFFQEEECAIQYHPPKSEYVNNHPYVLHLWKPQGEYIPRPPMHLV